MTLKTCIYLSVADLVGDGVDFVGDVTGLVSSAAPFTRLALNSANLQGCTGQELSFCLFK